MLKYKYFLVLAKVYKAEIRFIIQDQLVAAVEKFKKAKGKNFEY